MFDIGFTELMLVGVLGLIILGPERLPKAARTLGLVVGRVRRTMAGIQQQIEEEVNIADIKEKLKNPTATLLNESDSQATDTPVTSDTSNHHGTDGKDVTSEEVKAREKVALP